MALETTFFSDQWLLCKCQLWQLIFPKQTYYKLFLKFKNCNHIW